MRASLLGVLLVLTVGGLGALSFDEGKDAFGRQDWKGAATLFSRFLQENPGDPQAPAAAFLRGVALYQQADYRSSLDAFQKLERTWPQSEFARRLPYWKGTAALAAGQPALAERELAAQARYPEEEPFTTRALLNLALARTAQGKAEPALEALAAFTQASREPALLAQAWAVWADEDRKAGRSDQALAHYRASWSAQPGGRWDLSSRTGAVDVLTAHQRWAEARDLIDDSAAAHPAEAGQWAVRRVAVYRGLGDLTALAPVLEGLWSRETDPAKKQEWAANRARLAEESGKPDPAWWAKAALGPDEALGAQAVLRQAFLLETGGQPAPAAGILEAWASSHPAAPDRETVRGRAAQDRILAGDRPGAVAAWGRLLADYPRSAQVPAWLLARGRALLEGGDTVRSLADLSRLLKEFPKADQAAEARYQTGLVYLARQEPARAEAWFYGLVQDLKSGDLYQRALLARGISFVNSGQTDLARGSLQRLVRESPQGPWTASAWSALGRNALQGRLWDEAADAFARAEALAADPAEKARALWSFAEARAGAGSPDAASAAFARYARDYAGQPRADEALYRRGAVHATAKQWGPALEAWEPTVQGMRGTVLTQTREGMATAFLRLGRPQDGWDQLMALEGAAPSPDVWYRWAQAATVQGEADWAARAFRYLLQNHPASAAAEAALPRAAGALLVGGQAAEALDRYAEYFAKFGRQSAAAPVARAAVAAATAYPATLEALVSAARTWNLAPEVAAEFRLAWAQSRLDSDTEQALGELADLSRTAPWTSQRSEALAMVGRWQLGRGRLAEARTALEAASVLGDDLSVFKARWGLAQVTEREGDLTAAARQRESAEKSAGPGVPLEFRLQVLAEAAATWEAAKKPEEAQRVRARIAALYKM